MAVVVKPNKIIFETDMLESTLVATFEYYIHNLPRAKGAGVMKMLQTCDDFNYGIYENTYAKEVTKVTLTYYTRSEKVEVSIQYGEWKGFIKGDGKVSGFLFGHATLYGVKESIEYLSTHYEATPKKTNGYKIVFTLRQAK